MSTLHFHQITTSTPEQFLTALIDFGPGRSKVFGNSADDYLKVHHRGPTAADVTEGSGGVWERLHYDWSDPNKVVMKTTDSNIWGGSSGHIYTFTRRPDGTTDVDAVVVREGKNLKGRALGLVLGTVGKGVLEKAFHNTVKAIEARNGEGNWAEEKRLILAAQGHSMTSFDYDVAIIGSGFGGSVAALRAAEKGYRVGVMESGRRWKDEDIPKTQWNLPSFLWMPAAEMYGIQRIEYLDDVLILSGAGVGGGSHVYANTLYVPPKQFFNAPEWAGIADWADELAPCIDQAARMLGVVRYPYMPTDVDRHIQQVAIEMGRGDTFNKAPVGVYFGSPGVEVDDPYFGGIGPRRTGCISCGNCNIGCGHNAKNKLTTNYLYLAEQLGVEIHELHEVYELVPLEGGGFEVHTRHPGWAQRAAHLHRHAYTAEQVIVAAHAYGSSKLLLHMQHNGRLPGLSRELGQRARTNSEQLLAITRTHGQWAVDPEKVHITPGSVSITSGVWPDAVTSIEPTIWGVGSDVFAFLVTYHQHGEQHHPALSWLKQLAQHPTQVLSISDPRHWSERTVIMLCMQTTDTSIELYWHDGLLRSRHGSGTPPPVHIPIVEDFVDRVAKKMDGSQGAVLFEALNRNASAHFIGGIPIGESSERGAVDPYQRAFGQPGLHVMDGSVMPANPGVNPSLLITALAERAMSLWPNNGDSDTRPPLGSGYERVRPVMPRRPIVPAGAPGELRLDAKQSDVIPDYPY